MKAAVMGSSRSGSFCDNMQFENKFFKKAVGFQLRLTVLHNVSIHLFT